MALTATPLSRLWRYRLLIDQIKATLGEYDETVLTDDMIRTHIMLATCALFKMVPKAREPYKVTIPFRLPVDPEAEPIEYTWTLLPPTTEKMFYEVATGVHYETPTNFSVLGWFNIWNNESGGCRHCVDDTQVYGHAFSGNTLHQRSIVWHERSQHLIVSVGAGFSEDLQVTGVAYRTPIPAAELEAVGVASGLEDDEDTEFDEAVLYKLKRNDYDLVDIHDDHIQVVTNMVLIRCWSTLRVQPTEQVSEALQAQMSRIFGDVEERTTNIETRKKQTQQLQ